MLRVSDTEVQVERFLTREERERVEAQRAEEEARRAALARDNGEGRVDAEEGWGVFCTECGGEARRAALARDNGEGAAREGWGSAIVAVSET